MNQVARQMTMPGPTFGGASVAPGTSGGASARGGTGLLSAREFIPVWGGDGAGFDYERLAEAIAARGPGMVANMPISAAVATGDLPTEILRRLRSIEHLWG